MASDTYTLVYKFSTLGQFGEPHPRYNLQDLPVMASKLASEEKDKVEEIINESWKCNFVAFYDSKKTDTQAYIFTDAAKDAKLIVLAFRGSSSKIDWLLDFQVIQIPVKTHAIGDHATVYVHVGFWLALSLDDDATTVYPGQQEPKNGQPFAAIRDTLIQLVTDHPDAKILVTGHSLGGALALIFTFKLSLELEQQYKGITSFDKYKVVTFGQPKVGDPNFREYMNSLGLNYTRVVNMADIVPHRPLRVNFPLLKYSHVGIVLHHFSKDGSPGNPLHDHDISGYVSHYTKETLEAVKAAELLWADPPWARFNPLTNGEEVISQGLALADVTMGIDAISCLQKEQILGLEHRAVSFRPTPSSNPSILGDKELLAIKARLRVQIILEEMVEKVREKMIQMVNDEEAQKMRVKILEVMRQDRLTSISAVGEEVKEVPAKAITPLP